MSDRQLDELNGCRGMVIGAVPAVILWLLILWVIL